MAATGMETRVRLPDATAMLFVSLYVILLAFFILLTSIGRPDDSRTRSVLNSLDTAFPGQVPFSRLQAHRGASHILSAAEALLQSRLDRLDLLLSGGGDRLDAALPDTALFRAGTPAFSEQTPDFLLLLADLLRTDPAGRNITIALHFSAAAEGLDLAQAQSSRLAAAFENAGIETNRLSITLDPALPAGRLVVRLAYAGVDSGRRRAT